MKFYKLLAGFSLVVLASISINASAQTAACTWSSVYGYGSGGISYTVFVCKTTTGTQIASRTDTYNYQYGQQRTCGTPTVSGGYKSTGVKQGSYYPLSCNDIIVAVASSSASSTSSSTMSTSNVCYSGEFKIIQTSPTNYQPFDPNFCGPQPQCEHTVTVLDQHSYPRLKYTCK